MMQNSQILVLFLFLTTVHGMNAAWVGHKNPFNYQLADEIEFHGVSFEQFMNQKNEDGDTLLHRAVKANNIQKVEYLILLGVDVNQKNNVGRSPLHVAARNNAVEITKLLVAAGAHINQKNIHGNTPLHLAIEWNSKGIIQLLISAGADIAITNENGCTARALITMSGTRKIFDQTLKKSRNR